MKRAGIVRTILYAIALCSILASGGGVFAQETPTPGLFGPLEPSLSTEAQSKAAGYLSKLNPEELNKLFDDLGIKPSDEFFNCLCPGGFYYYVGPEGGPCRHNGPLWGHDYAGFDASKVASCSAANPLPDGRSVLGVVMGAATAAAVAGETNKPKPQDAKARVCQAVTAEWTPRRDELKARVERGRAQLDAWMKDYLEKQKEKTGWIQSLTDLYVGILTGGAVFPEQGMHHPGPVLAEVNQDIGALECLSAVFAECERAADQGAASATTEEGASPDTTESYAIKLSTKLRGRAQEEFDLSLERKKMFDQNPNEYRWATEANQMVGYSDMCREVADHLEKLSSSDAKARPSSSNAD